ncbi:MAG: Mut7-C RNAse domain-containing protein [Desulfobacterales bacterium]|jgi:uncharacterized protein with PIN domain|nr:Mut7-C RNAse domain-containing protein [Desulfobacterales bacterium]
MHTHASPSGASPPGAPAFAVERTLGRLGKWLRLLGFDALLETECPPAKFPQRCGEGRILLTRTRRVLAALPERAAIFIRADDPFAQAAQVLRELGLSACDLRPFSRCLRCNLPIEAIGRQQARGAVPDYVWQTAPGFGRCPRCLRLYWAGTHTARSLERIQRLFEARP